MTKSTIRKQLERRSEHLPRTSYAGPPRRPSTPALERLLKVEGQVVRKYSEKLSEGGCFIAGVAKVPEDKNYNSLYRYVSSALSKFTVQDLQSYILKRSKRSNRDASCDLMRGIYTGVLLDILTRRKRSSGKISSFVFDLQGRAFPYLFSSARNFGKLTVRNARGDGICKGIATFGGKGEALYLENVSSSGLYKAGSEGGNIGLIVMENCKVMGGRIGINRGNIGILSLINTRGSQSQYSRSGEDGRIGTVCFYNARGKCDRPSVVAGEYIEGEKALDFSHELIRKVIKGKESVPQRQRDLLSMLIIDDHVTTNKAKGYHLLKQRYGDVFGHIDRCKGYIYPKRGVNGEKLLLERPYDVLLLDHQLHREDTTWSQVVETIRRNEGSELSWQNENIYIVGVSELFPNNAYFEEEYIVEAWMNSYTGPGRTNPRGLFEEVDYYLRTVHPTLYGKVAGQGKKCGFAFPHVDAPRPDRQLTKMRTELDELYSALLRE